MDTVDHPSHYNSHPKGIEAIDVIEEFAFNVANAIKYLWRANYKGSQRDDLRKALWYVQREIDRLDKKSGHAEAP
jgi:hypothetical protein